MRLYFVFENRWVRREYYKRGGEVVIHTVIKEMPPKESQEWDWD